MTMLHAAASGHQPTAPRRRFRVPQHMHARLLLLDACNSVETTAHACRRHLTARCTQHARQPFTQATTHAHTCVHTSGVRANNNRAHTTTTKRRRGGGAMHQNTNIDRQQNTGASHMCITTPPRRLSTGQQRGPSRAQMVPPTRALCGALSSCTGGCLAAREDETGDKAGHSDSVQRGPAQQLTSSLLRPHKPGLARPSHYCANTVPRVQVCLRSQTHTHTRTHLVLPVGRCKAQKHAHHRTHADCPHHTGSLEAAATAHALLRAHRCACLLLPTQRDSNQWGMPSSPTPAPARARTHTTCAATRTGVSPPAFPRRRGCSTSRVAAKRPTTLALRAGVCAPGALARARCRVVCCVFTGSGARRPRSAGWPAWSCTCWRCAAPPRPRAALWGPPPSWTACVCVRVNTQQQQQQ